MKLGLVGYGFGGRFFHAPFLRACDAVEIGGVVARAPETVANVKTDLPGVPTFGSLTEMIEVGAVEAVTITTPPASRKALVLEAISAGLHVVADKPFAVQPADAREMTDAAAAAGVVLTVFQNRRWDTDVRTLKRVIDDGKLGKIQRVHNRMEFPSLKGLLPGPGGGLLDDLGSHVVDQMLWLLGPAEAVEAQVVTGDVGDAVVDVSFVIKLRHANGAQSYIEASKANNLHFRELRAYGDLGAYIAHGTDVQTRAVLGGLSPLDDPEGWGIEPDEGLGTLYLASGAAKVRSEQSNVTDFYAKFAAAVSNGAPAPVSAEDGIHTVSVLEAARQSAAYGRTVDMTYPGA